MLPDGIHPKVLFSQIKAEDLPKFNHLDQIDDRPFGEELDDEPIDENIEAMQSPRGICRAWRINGTIL